MATPRDGRFTIFGAVRLAGLAVARRPSALMLMLLANMSTTAAFAAMEKIWFQGLESGALAGRLIFKLAYALNDATLGLMVLVVAVEGLMGRAENWSERWRRVRGGFAPALLLATLAELASVGMEINAYTTLTGRSPNHVGWIMLADLLLEILLACSIGLVAYAAVAPPRPVGFGRAVQRSLQLTRRARWRLGWLAALLWILTLIVSLLDFGLVRELTQNQPLHNAVGQAIYTAWYCLAVVLWAGIGAALARPEDDIERLATQFD